METLLRGAEKLCTVYALPGAAGRIAAQRARHAQLGNTLAYYEGRVAEQTVRLEGMNREWMADEDEAEKGSAEEVEGQTDAGMTEEDLRTEEEELRELERRKRELQGMLSAMDKDIGALRDM